MNDDECLDENGSAAALGGFIALILMGSCANMPYYQKQYDKDDPAPEKIEHWAQLATNQVRYITYSLEVKTR